MAEGNIDRLSIEIGASSKTASQKIDSLVTAMGQLKTAVNQIDSGAAGKLQALAVALKDLGGIGKISISKTIGENIGVLSGALKGIKSEDISMLRQTASAIKTLDGVGNIKISSTIAKNLVDIAAAVEMMPDNTSAKLEKFGSAMQNLKGISTAGYSKLPEAFTNIANAVSSISDDAVARIHRLTMALGRLKGVDLKNVSGALRAQQKAQSAKTGIGGKNSGVEAQTSGSASGEISKSVSRAKALANALEKVASVASKAASVISTISKALRAAVRFANRLVSGLAKGAAGVIKNGVKSLVGGATKGFKYLWDHSAVQRVIKAYNSLNKVISSFGRIAFYRAVRSAIRFITDAFKEGSERAYYFAKQYGEATKYIAEALDNMSSGNFKMTNQLGAAWATLMATLQPIISAIIAMVNRAAAAITQLFAILGGKGTYMKAIDYNKQWAESAGGAAGAAKEWRNQLMGFDEINRLDDQNDGGGGGGGALSDFNNMFEEAEITSDLLKNIKKYMDAGEWARLGEYLGDEFNKMINNIKWEHYGRLIGQKIGHAVTTAYNFFRKADFINLGNKIAEFLNKAGDGINFKELGHLSSQISLVLWKVLYGAVVGTDWKQVGSDLSDYFSGALDELSAFISTLKPTKVASAIKDFFGNIKVAEITSKLAEVLRKAFTFLSETIRLLLPFDFGKKTADGIGDAINTDANKISVLGSLKTLMTNVFLGLSATIASLLPDDLRKNVIDGIQAKITGGEEVGEPIGVIDALKTLLTTALNALSLGISALIPGDFGDKLQDGIANKIKGGGENGESTSNLSDAIKTFIETALAAVSLVVPDGFLKKVKDAILNGIASIDLAEIHNVIQFAFDKAVFGEDYATKSWANKKGEYAGKEFFQGLRAKFLEGQIELNADVDNLEKTVKTTADNVNSDTAGIGNELKATQAEVSTTATDMTNAVTTAKTDAVGACDETETAFKGLNAASDVAMKDVRDTFDETSENAVDNLGEIDTACGNTGSAFTDVQSVGTSAMSGLDSGVASSSSSINSSLASVASQAWNTMSALSSLGSYSLDLGGGRSFSYRPNKGGMFAEGGFPEDGLFFANHGEMVGRFSNGRTAVANNEQITAGIANAVYGAFMSAFSQTGGNGGNSKQPIILNINGREFARATYADQQAVAREHGSRLVVNGVGA